jgi:hypothetical protein
MRWTYTVALHVRYNTGTSSRVGRVAEGRLAIDFFKEGENGFEYAHGLIQILESGNELLHLEAGEDLGRTLPSPHSVIESLLRLGMRRYGLDPVDFVETYGDQND